MDLDDQIELEHLLFLIVNVGCGKKVKTFRWIYYLTRKDRGTLPSAYSYECKECT
jgi:hypothetical protein